MMGQEALAIYAVAARDPVDAIDMVDECQDLKELRLLWLMLTTHNEKSDMELNSLMARCIAPRLRARGVDMSPIKEGE